jgi:hypothetical protein
MEHLKRLWLWTGLKWERYNFGPNYPSLMFWLITAIFLIEFAQQVRIAVEYHALLPASVLWTVAIMLLMFPFTWIVYYRLHRRFKRLSEEGPPPNQRLMKEAQALSIAFILGAYILFGFGLGIVRRLLEQVYH